MLLEPLHVCISAPAALQQHTWWPCWSTSHLIDQHQQRVQCAHVHRYSRTQCSCDSPQMKTVSAAYYWHAMKPHSGDRSHDPATSCVQKEKAPVAPFATPRLAAPLMCSCQFPKQTQLSLVPVLPKARWTHMTKHSLYVHARCVCLDPNQQRSKDSKLQIKPVETRFNWLVQMVLPLNQPKLAHPCSPFQSFKLTHLACFIVQPTPAVNTALDCNSQ